jgi:serine/threonine-protein kinase
MTAMATWQPTSSDPLFRNGQTITGVWNRKSYVVEGMLGCGANGEVYCVRSKSGDLLALKVSPNSGDIALEHKILKQLQGAARGVGLGPLVYDLDDVDTPRGKAFYYVMERVRGTSLSPFLKKRGLHWTPVLMLQLCTDLERMHRLGYCFGDLKAENCLVDEKRGTLRLIDFGGVTPFGRGIKEYTEWYDRAWWGQGSRLAEESYDVFALSMMVVALLDPELRKKMAGLPVPNFPLLKQSVLADQRFGQWRDLLSAVWSGRVTTVARFRERLLPIVQASVKQEKLQKEDGPAHDWSDWLLFSSAAVLAGVILSIFL